MLFQKTSVINAEVFFLQEDTGEMKVIFSCLPCLLLQACSEEETPLEKFLKSETPSFYAEVTGEVAVAELGETINLVQGENASIVSSHTIGTPGISMNSFTSWRSTEENGKGVIIKSPFFEYQNNASIESTFGVGTKQFDGLSSGYIFYTFQNFSPYLLATDSNGDIKNGKVEVPKYKRVPTHEPPNTGGYEEYIYVWLTLECDLYNTTGANVGKLSNGQALCVFPSY